MNRPSQRPGFTLLELILALALSALLMLIVSATLRTYSQLISNRRTEVVSAQVARAILKVMAEDIQATFTSTQEASATTSSSATSTSTSTGNSTTSSTATSSQTSAGGNGGGTGSSLTSGSFSTSTSTTTSSSTTTTNNGGTDTGDTSLAALPGVFGDQYQLQIDILGRYVQPVKYDQLVAAGVNVQSAQLLSDPKVIRYYLRSLDPSELAGTPLEPVGENANTPRNVLIRQIQGRAQAVYTGVTGGTPLVSDEQYLSDQVVQLEFAYYDGLDWVSTWDMDLDGSLPTAIQITITIMDADQALTNDGTARSHTYQRTVYLPNASPPLTAATSATAAAASTASGSSGSTSGSAAGSAGSTNSSGTSTGTGSTQ